MKKALLIMFAALFVFSGTLKAADNAGSAAAQELQKVQEQTKNQAEHAKDKLKKNQQKHAEIKDLREDFKTEINDLQAKRKEALKAGNKEEAKKIQEQIKAKKQEKKNKIQDLKKKKK